MRKAGALSSVAFLVLRAGTGRGCIIYYVYILSEIYLYDKSQFFQKIWTENITLCYNKLYKWEFILFILIIPAF